MKHTPTLLTKSYNQMQLERVFFFYLQLYLITDVELLHVQICTLGVDYS